MKKFYKKGFSLAEILIALGIISIISTMGVTIARRGIDRAYNLYVYSSYKGILDAINIANAEAETVGDGLSSRIDNEQPYIRSLLTTLSASNIGEDGGSISFSTPNGVSYSIVRSFCEGDDPSCENDASPGEEVQSSSFNPDYHRNFIIRVTIPQKKTRGISTATYCLLYQTNSRHELLLPVDEVSGDVACEASDSLKGLATRMDLLPFYVDTGSEGRVLPDANGVATYNPRTFTSLSGAYCQIFAEDISYNNATVIDCAAPPADFESGLGTALLVSPQNL